MSYLSFFFFLYTQLNGPFAADKWYLTVYRFSGQLVGIWALFAAFLLQCHFFHRSTFSTLTLCLD